MSKSLVREASIEDTFDILILAKEFSKEAPETHKWNKDKTEKFILTAIESPNATVIVFEDDGEIVGAIVGLLNEMYMSQTMVATELAWFVSKDYRGKKGSILLVKTFEEWARKNNADYVCMGDIHGIISLENLYGRLGYLKCETTYMKEI
tara:strand:+ start:445 stop:894 length:450 start_codon:yes stop_codon:yes gene_type:complete